MRFTQKKYENLSYLIQYYFNYYFIFAYLFYIKKLYFCFMYYIFILKMYYYLSEKDTHKQNLIIFFYCVNSLNA